MHNKSELINKLNTLCTCLNDLYEVNCGGCCYLAYLISKHLDKIGIVYNLVVYDDEPINKQKALDEVKQKKSFDEITKYGTRTHYCLSIEKEIINNAYDHYKKFTIKGLSYKDIYWIYRNGYWNKNYDKQNNKCVKGMISSFFKKYES